MGQRRLGALGWAMALALLLVLGLTAWQGTVQLLRYWQLQQVQQQHALADAQPALALDGAVTPAALQPWRRAWAQGYWQPGWSVLLEQPRGGQPGAWVVTPLCLASPDAPDVAFGADDAPSCEQAVAVLRGWLPANATLPALPVSQRIEGRLTADLPTLPGVPVGTVSETDWAGDALPRLPAITLAAYARATDLPLLPVVLTQQDPAAEVLWRESADPWADGWSHLRQGLLWLAGSLAAVLGLLLLVRWSRRPARLQDEAEDAADPVQVRRRFRRLVYLTLFLTFDLIMFGAFVRLTDSGLGCPDWPGCYSRLSPIGAMHDIRAAVEAMPYGPVSVAKAWIEMIHRYVATFLGILIIAITWMAWRYRPVLNQSPWLASWLLVAVCVQGAFGAWTVTLKLMPVIVTLHLLLGIGLLAMLTLLAARQRPHAPVPETAARWRPLAWLGLLLLTVQIALGGWVSTNYAALACMDFPTCHGMWVPEMDFAGGFSLVRALGELPSGELISQSALTAIHWTHRNIAFVVVLVLGLLGLRLRRVPGVKGPARLLLLLLVAQFLTGLTSIFLQWPIVIAVLHNGGAALLAATTVTLVLRLSRAGRQPPVAEP